MMIQVSNKLIGGHGKQIYRDAAANLGDTWVIDADCVPHINDGYIISSPYRLRATRNAITESGFFWRASHIDTRGLWAEASLNLPEAQPQIESYKAERSAQDIVFSNCSHRSKYDQFGDKVTWEGVVLAAQQPHDRSVKTLKGNSTENYYWPFVKGACKHYGKHLYVKLHPHHDARSARGHRDLMERYGCSGNYADNSVLEKCKFVLVYTSTYAVDCWLHNVRVAQYAPGYFSDTGAVTFTDGEYPDDVEDTTWKEQKLLDFLAWRYCYCMDMQPRDFVELVNIYANSDDLFPVPERLSWAANQHLSEVEDY